MSGQKRRFQLFLVIGFFLSICLDLFKNAISLPSWIGPFVPLLIVAFVALLILVETVEEDSSSNQERRTLFKRLILPVSTIVLLTISTIFFLVEDTNVKEEREQLEKEQQAFETQRKSQLTQLRIGLLPIGNNVGGKINTNDFDNSLTNQLGIPVTSQYRGSTYTDLVNALASREVEVGWLGPLSYVYAHQKYGAKVILCQVRPGGQKSYQSYILAGANTGIRTLQDLKGRSFALVDPLSTSGNLVPRYVLKKAGLDPDKDITATYVRSHEDVLQGVSSGSYPAGAVASDVYNVYQEELRQKGSRTDEFVILAKSMDIPEGAIAVRKDIQLYDTLRIEDAFLTVGEIDPAILNTIGIAGFAKVTDETYAGLLQIAEYLNIDLSTYNG